MNYSNGFAGARKDYISSSTMPSMPFQHRYQYHGNGRDTYIGHDNGGFNKMYQPDLHPIRGAFGFGDPRFGNNVHTLSSIQAKRPNYNFNGTGRDTYIA